MGSEPISKLPGEVQQSILRPGERVNPFFFKGQESINSGRHYVNYIGILISGHHCVELHIDVAEEQPWDVRSPADKAGAHARLARWQLRSISVYLYKRPNSILHE